MAAAASISMPSITASKSAWRRANARTARSSTRVTGVVRLAAIQRRRRGGARRPGAGGGSRTAPGRRRCRRRCGRTRRWHTSRAAGPAAAPPCRGRSWCRRARTTASTASRSAGAAPERVTASRSRHEPQRAEQAGQPRPVRVSFTRVATGSPRRSRRGQAARQADDHRRLQPQPPVARAARQVGARRGSARRIGPAARRTRARSPGVAAGARRSSTPAPCRGQQVGGQVAAVERRRGPSRRPANGSAPATPRTARPTAPRWRGPRRAGRARAGRPAWRSSGNSPSARPSSA